MHFYRTLCTDIILRDYWSHGEYSKADEFVREERKHLLQLGEDNVLDRFDVGVVDAASLYGGHLVPEEITTMVPL